MTTGFSKDPTERLWVAVDFAARLREGDSLAQILQVSLERHDREARGYVEAAAEVPIPNSQIQGTQVQLLLGDEADAGAQPLGRYRVVVEVRTGEGEELTARVPLVVTG